MTLSKRRNVVTFLKFFKVLNRFLEFLTVMVFTFVLSQCFIVKLLTKPILLRILKRSHLYDNRLNFSLSGRRPKGRESGKTSA